MNPILFIKVKLSQITYEICDKLVKLEYDFLAFGTTNKSKTSKKAHVCQNLGVANYRVVFLKEIN